MGMKVTIVHGYDTHIEVTFDPDKYPGKVVLSLHFPKTRKRHLGAKELPYPLMSGNYSLKRVRFTKKQTHTGTEWVTDYGPFNPPKVGENRFKIKWPTYSDCTYLEVEPNSVRVSHFSLSASSFSVPLV